MKDTGEWAIEIYSKLVSRTMGHSDETAWADTDRIEKALKEAIELGKEEILKDEARTTITRTSCL